MGSPARRVAMLDSGLGGLTVLSALRALTADTDIVYFADTAHVPYGGRKLDEVSRLGASIVKRLQVHNPSVIQAWSKSLSGYEARRDRAIRFHTVSLN